MSLSRPSPARRDARLVPGALAGVLTLVTLGGLAAYRLLVAPATHPLAVPGLVATLLALSVLQACRAVRTADWLRRAAILATPVGVLVALLALQPAGGCPAAGVGTCGPAGTNPYLLAVGALATLVPVYLDLRRSVPREADPAAR